MAYPPPTHIHTHILTLSLSLTSSHTSTPTAPTALSSIQQQQLDQMAAAAELNISAGNIGPIQGSGGGEGAGVTRDEAVISKIQEKLLTMNEEKGGQTDVATLQQEENVSISGSNARLMIMKKLSRKTEVCVGVGVGGEGERRGV